MEGALIFSYNPLMANVFFRAGYIETWGRGVQKICEACKRHGSPVPSYEILGDTITIQFKAHPSAIELSRTENGKQKLTNGTLGDTLDDTLDDTLGDTLDDTLDDTLESRIVRLILKNPNITQKEMATQEKVSVESVKRAMKILTDSGKITREGGKRYGKWVVRS